MTLSFFKIIFNGRHCEDVPYLSLKSCPVSHDYKHHSNECPCTLMQRARVGLLSPA